MCLRRNIKLLTLTYLLHVTLLAIFYDHEICIYTVSQKTSTFYFSNNCQKLTDFNVYCSHFTLGNPKKSFFDSITHRDFRLLHYLRRNKLQLSYCSLSVYLLLFTASYYLRSPILWSVYIISFVSHFQSHQCEPTTGSFQSHQHLEERNIICSQM